jgi:hypothetical protein
MNLFLGDLEWFSRTLRQVPPLYADSVFFSIYLESRQQLPLNVCRFLGFRSFYYARKSIDTPLCGASHALSPTFLVYLLFVGSILPIAPVFEKVKAHLHCFSCVLKRSFITIAQCDNFVYRCFTMAVARSRARFELSRMETGRSVVWLLGCL